MRASNIYLSKLNTIWNKRLKQVTWGQLWRSSKRTVRELVIPAKAKWVSTWSWKKKRFNNGHVLNSDFNFWHFYYTPLSNWKPPYHDHRPTMAMYSWLWIPIHSHNSFNWEPLQNDQFSKMAAKFSPRLDAVDRFDVVTWEWNLQNRPLLLEPSIR